MVLNYLFGKKEDKTVLQSYPLTKQFSDYLFYSTIGMETDCQ